MRWNIDGPFEMLAGHEYAKQFRVFRALPQVTGGAVTVEFPGEKVFATEGAFQTRNPDNNALAD
jgi:hypothetical protein